MRNRDAAARREVPHHVRLADPLHARERAHGLPGELRIGQVVPAREVERLSRAGERGPELALSLYQELERVALGVGEAGDPHGQDLRGGKALAERTYDEWRTDSARARRPRPTPRRPRP